MKVLGRVLSVALAFPAAQAMAQATAVPAHNPAVYRVTYTLTDMDAGKRVGVQHYSVVLSEGGRTTLKNGSKIPVATGSYNAGVSTGVASIGVQTQFTYLDIGINIDTQLSLPVGGTWTVRAKVEQSSATEHETISGVTEPVVRQSVLDASTTLTAGKPQMIGTLDFPGSTRHLEVEVLLEPVK